MTKKKKSFSRHSSNFTRIIKGIFQIAADQDLNGLPSLEGTKQKKGKQSGGYAGGYAVLRSREDKNTMDHL